MHPAFPAPHLRTNGVLSVLTQRMHTLTTVLQCLNLCILSAVLLGILYLFFGAFPLVFQNNHGFSTSQTGLGKRQGQHLCRGMLIRTTAFLGLFVGMITGVSTDPIWRRVYGRLVDKAQGSEPGMQKRLTIRLTC